MQAKLTIEDGEACIDFIDRRKQPQVNGCQDLCSSPKPYGIGLARWVLKNRLGTKMILTSGNFPELDASDPIAEIPFLLKPVRPNQLLKVLSETDAGR